MRVSATNALVTYGLKNFASCPNFGWTRLNLERISATRALLALAVTSMLLLGAQPGRAQTETVLHSFGSNPGDGQTPFNTGLTIDAKSKNGILYGVTGAGGTYGYGTVFKFDPVAQVEEVLYSFTGGTDGANPYGSVVRDKAGNLYGTTYAGGANGVGTVFKLAPDGTETVLHSFANDNVDGSFPYSGLTSDKAGNLYGTTDDGGIQTVGTVFKVSPTGSETILYNFTGGADGCHPGTPVLVGPGEVLYGTTGGCGADNGGVVFKLTPSGVETVLHAFAGQTDGWIPLAGVTLDKAGNLYGTTYGGGTYSAGTVFKLTPSGTETILHKFSGGTDGSNPSSPVALDKLGNIYGTTQGGNDNYGTVFKLDKTGAETVLHNFSRGGDGVYPASGVVRGKKGVLYGLTFGGGAYGYGTVYKVVR